MRIYASINRDKNSGTGTKIRLSEKKHPLLYLFLKMKFQEADDLNASNPDAVPCFIAGQEDWDRFAKELRVSKEIGYTKIFLGAYEFCIVCKESFRSEIMNTELLRHEAQKQRDAKKEEE